MNFLLYIPTLIKLNMNGRHPPQCSSLLPSRGHTRQPPSSSWRQPPASDVSWPRSQDLEDAISELEEVFSLQSVIPLLHPVLLAETKTQERVGPGDDDDDDYDDDDDDDDDDDNDVHDVVLMLLMHGCYRCTVADALLLLL